MKALSPTRSNRWTLIPFVPASDGGAALEKAHEHQPDIPLLDAMMPVMDELQVLEHLKAEPATQTITVIMVTAKGQEQDQLRAREGGARVYITMPWEAGEVEFKVLAAELAARGQ